MERADRFEEQVVVLDALLRGEPVTHQGPHYPTSVAAMPQPVQRPRPPMVLAAHGPGAWSCGSLRGRLELLRRPAIRGPNAHVRRRARRDPSPAGATQRGVPQRSGATRPPWVDRSSPFASSRIHSRRSTGSTNTWAPTVTSGSRRSSSSGPRCRTSGPRPRRSRRPCGRRSNGSPQSGSAATEFPDRGGRAWIQPRGRERGRVCPARGRPRPHRSRNGREDSGLVHRE